MAGGKGRGTQKTSENEESQSKISEMSDSLKELSASVLTLKASVDTLSIKVDNVDSGQKETKDSLEHIKLSLEMCTANLSEVTACSNTNSKQIKILESALNKERLDKAKLISHVEKLQDRLIQVESQSRRDNLLIDGIQESDNEKCEELVIDFFKNKLKLDDAHKIQIVRCHRVGPKRRTSPKPRSLIVKFHWYGDRMRVWQARRQLQGTATYLNEDFPKEIVDRRRVLRPVLKKAKALGMEAYLSVDPLTVNGNRYTANDLRKLPAELDPAKIATPLIGNAFAFFGGQSPLSNFHVCNFTMDGIEYDCEERHYQWEKARFAKRRDLQDAVMSARSPGDVNRVGREINKYIDLTDWHNNHAIDAMTKGLTCKFEQNPHLMDFLNNTGDKLLVEANPNDKFWGCGLSLTEKDKILDVRNWPGENQLGKILTSIRDGS